MTPTPAAPPLADRTRPHEGLLAQVRSTTLDQDYQAAADRRATREPAEAPPTPARRLGRRATAAVVVLLFAAMLTVSAIRTQQQKPVEAAERGELVSQIHARQHRLDALNGQLSTLDRTVGDLQSAVTSDQALQRRVAGAVTSLAAVTGASEVAGPGVSVVVDDAPDAGESSSGGTILDTDLQQLVNALWSVGAEAMAINGHRLTSLTAIRTAGRAITVDYRSLTPPYVVEAIGDPQTMPARLLATPGGQAWLSLQQNFGIRFDVRPVTSLTLPAAPQGLHEARPGGAR